MTDNSKAREAMLRASKVRAAAVVGVAACLVVTGCSTTVAGEASVESAAALANPEIGSFVAAPRTIPATEQGDGELLEGYRMAETVPFLYEIDPAIHFQGSVRAGSRSSIVSTVRSAFGQAVSTRFDKAEAGVTVGATDEQQGAKYDSTRKERSVLVGLFRMPTAADAASAVSTGLLDLDQATSASTDVPTKTAASIPGYPGAVAYTQTGKYSGNATVAFLAYKQYVIGVTGAFSLEQIRTFLDKQTKALDAFKPTPLDKVSTLGLDPDGVARLTLPPSGTSGGYALPSRAAVLRQSDVSRSVKTFADAGVDVVGMGASTVYRAKDAGGAKHIADEFIAENRGAFTNIETQQVTNVPNSTCLTYPTYEGSTSRMTWCVVPVGRYLAEYSDTQPARAVQAIGAMYIILRDNK